MADLLDTSSEVLNSVLQSHAGRSVTYTRSGETPITVLATVGETRYDTIESNGYAVQVTVRDYIISADQIVIDSAQTLPREGDTITDVVNGTSRVFAVFPGGLNGQAFRDSDPQGRRLRIHTQEVA